MKSSTLATEHTNMLLGLAWLGELDRRQIQRLWFADRRWVATNWLEEVR
jgi:hypothetical protein